MLRMIKIKETCLNCQGAWTGGCTAPERRAFCIICGIGCPGYIYRLPQFIRNWITENNLQKYKQKGGFFKTIDNKIVSVGDKVYIKTQQFKRIERKIIAQISSPFKVCWDTPDSEGYIGCRYNGVFAERKNILC